MNTVLDLFSKCGNTILYINGNESINNGYLVDSTNNYICQCNLVSNVFTPYVTIYNTFFYSLKIQQNGYIKIYNFDINAYYGFSIEFWITSATGFSDNVEIIYMYSDNDSSYIKIYPNKYKLSKTTGESSTTNIYPLMDSFEIWHHFFINVTPYCIDCFIDGIRNRYSISNPYISKVYPPYEGWDITKPLNLVIKGGNLSTYYIRGIRVIKHDTNEFSSDDIAYKKINLPIRYYWVNKYERSWGYTGYKETSSLLIPGNSAIYNDKLYWGYLSKIYTFNGSSALTELVTLSGTATYSNSMGRVMALFKNYYYYGRNGTTANGGGFWRFNASNNSSTLIDNPSDGSAGVYSIHNEYNGYLYYSNNGNLMRYDGTNAPTKVENSILCSQSCIYRDKIYFFRYHDVNYSTKYITVYDGSTYTNLIGYTAQPNGISVAVCFDKIYFAEYLLDTDNPDKITNIISYDGSTFKTEYTFQSKSSTKYTVTDIISFGDKLFISGYYNGAIEENEIYMFNYVDSNLNLLSSIRLSSGNSSIPRLFYYKNSLYCSGISISSGQGGGYGYWIYN